MHLPRVWHPYQEWEEVAYGMWSEVSDRAAYLRWAIHFTGDHKQYGHYMNRVVDEWEISCENALTDPSLNRKAWVGHAACALAGGCPEDIVRQAWGKLTDEQRTLANRQADRAIRRWEERYAASIGLCPNVGKPMLL